MTAVSSEASRKVSFWSFIFAIAVVVIHCAWCASSAPGRLAIALFKDTFARMAVPFFFVCSGYFLACHMDESGWWIRALRKRFATLVIPYVLWTVLFAGVLFAEAHEVMGPGGFGLNPCKMPALAPFWYVRCLLILVVLAPVLRRLVDLSPRVTLWTAYALPLGLSPLSAVAQLDDADGIGGLLSYGLSLEGLFYFLGGIYLRRFPRKELSRRVCGVLLGVGALLTVLRLWAGQMDVRMALDLRCFITPLVLTGLWGLVRPPALPRFFTGCAFPIFLMHGLVIASLRYWGGAYCVVNPWVELFLGVGVPVIAYRLLCRFAPRVANILFGGRV